MRIGTEVRWKGSSIDLNAKKDAGTLTVQILTLVPDGVLERCLAEDLRTYGASVSVIAGTVVAYLPNSLLSETTSLKALVEESAFTAERQYRESVGA